MSLRCHLRAIWATVTMAAFWRSLAKPPLVVASGHVWPWPPVWGKPAPSPAPEDWPGLVEFDESACVDCGQPESGWRRYYGVAG